jgi:hypothetical protein
MDASASKYTPMVLKNIAFRQIVTSVYLAALVGGAWLLQQQSVLPDPASGAILIALIVLWSSSRAVPAPPFESFRMQSPLSHLPARAFSGPLPRRVEAR